MGETLREIDLYFPWFLPTLVAVLGACVGSFLNVVIYRVPAGRSVVKPGSMCRCGRPIAWYDNLPVLSWILLRGRARCCGARFSARYPAIEALTALVFSAAWMQYPPLAAGAVMVALGLFLAAAFIDLDTMEIPDVFSIGGFLVGVGLSFAVPALHGFGEGLWLLEAMRGLVEALLGAFVGSGLILWFALVAELILRKEAMGFGDVKLMGAIGAFFGWQGAVFALFGGAVLGLVLLFPMKWLQEPVPAEATPEGEEAEDVAGRIPFGPSLVAGGLLYALWLREPVDAYFAEFYALLTSTL